MMRSTAKQPEKDETRADAPGTWRVPLVDVRVDQELLEAANYALASGWWSMGARVDEFEKSFARFVGARHGVAVSSGTAALHLAVLGAACGPGDEVIVPSLTFAAAANCVVVAGAQPVFCDIVGPHDLNLDPDDMEAAVGPATKALIVLHYGGFACDMDAVLEIAERHQLLVIEDCAHAPGASLRGRRCGTIGDVGCFSFFANKNLPIGEGGMIVTDDEVLADRIRLLRSHGMTTVTWDRHRGHAAAYDVVLPGLNYRLDETRAAIGLVQLGRLVQRNDARARIASRYRERLSGVVDGLLVAFAADDDHRRSSHHLSVVVLPPDADREHVRQQMASKGVQTSVHYPPIHRFSAYEKTRRPLAVTEAVADRILTLPLYPHLPDEGVDIVVDALLGALDADG